MRKTLLSLLLIMINEALVLADRTDMLINDDWTFRFSHQVHRNTERRVDLPHTWNAQDALSGKMDYKRGIGNYEKIIEIPDSWKGKRLFLRFEGVNSVANVFVNRKHIGEHRGGYGAFIFELTDVVEYGKKNSIWVRVNNAEQLDVMPLVGDFNFYGGIYRNVHLILTDDICISPLDYASSGVYLIQEKVSHESASVKAKILLSNSDLQTNDVLLNLSVVGNGKVVYNEARNVSLNKKENVVKEFDFTIHHPHLWNGVADPFIYDVQVSIVRNGVVIDNISQPLGLRYYHVDPNNGFFLNGNHLPLHGVCRHQDRAEIGNALLSIHHEEDAALMCDMGVNAVRLAHYPQASYFYQLMDEAGIVVWAEIPFVGPGGYEDKGFVDQLSFRENGKEQLKELIRQHFNHPSICFWGLFNEIKVAGDNPTEYVKELHQLVKQEDPTRPTTAASNQEGSLNGITDVIAWNRYDGWYGGMPVDMGVWLDKTHQQNPSYCIAISEYGAGASIYHQQETLEKTVPTGWFHPENWQTYYHIENWKVISQRPFLWASFVWNMFDFGAAHRTEGDRPGINDKGLVTFDRKTKKDAYYFYKANWNKKEPLLYIAERRIKNRKNKNQTIVAYTNLPNAVLFVNGVKIGIADTDAYSMVSWHNVELKEGENCIEVRSGKNKNAISDKLIINKI